MKLAESVTLSNRSIFGTINSPTSNKAVRQL